MASREDQVQSEVMVNGAEEAASRIFALDPAEGEPWWWMGGLATVKATAEQTGGHYTLVEVLIPEFPMEESLLHVHHFEDEGFYILEGEMTFYVGEQTLKARPGSYLFGPKDIPHAFSVDSGPARLLFILSPAGMEGPRLRQRGGLRGSAPGVRGNRGGSHPDRSRSHGYEHKRGLRLDARRGSRRLRTGCGFRLRRGRRQGARSR